MRRGGVGVGVGVLRVVMGKVYAGVVAWHTAFGAMSAGRATFWVRRRGRRRDGLRNYCWSNAFGHFVCQLRHASVSRSTWYWLK